MNTRINPDLDRLPLEREARARDKEDRLSDSHPLCHYRDVRAWVLLADPGAGKSDVFTTLALSEVGTCVSARDFVDLDLPANWHEPLFIDALDEITSGHAPGTTPLSLIRQKLHQLGNPKFRLSCREADWRGNADGEALKRLVGDDNFAELHLAPLTHWQSVALVAHWQAYSEAQAEAFMQEAQRRDLEGLLDNPQTLRLLVKAHAANGGNWPASKTQTYEMACAQLVREHNEEHLANTRDDTPPDDQTLLAAGYLCAVMLLSGSAAIALQRQSQPRAGVVTLSELKGTAPAPDLPTCWAALHTRLFRGNGTGDFWPVHRTVAEYLGAHYLASRIHAGLPASRVLALMLGEDGGLVPELRGLHAWLAAVAPPDLRRELIAHDPLGVVINGDVRAFNRDDKLAVLNALQHEASQDASFRRGSWASHPFGALATADMEADFKALLQSPERSPAHQALLGCVLDALMHGQHMLMLASVLEQVVRDKSYLSHLRTTALRNLIAYSSDSGNWTLLTALLTDVHTNAVEDLEDELLGTLLDALYPNHISPAEIWRYFRHPKTEHLLGAYWMFWHEFPKRHATPSEVATTLDALVAANYQLKVESAQTGEAELVGELLVQGISRREDEIDVTRLYRWLGLSLGEHFDSHLLLEHATAVKQWLENHPASYKTLFEYGLNAQAQEHIDSGLGWWRINAMFHRAAEPADAKSWYVSLAGKTTHDDWRHQLIFNAIRTVEHADGESAGTALLNDWKTLYPADAQWVDIVLEHRRAPPEPYPGYQAKRNEIKEKQAQQEREKTAFFQKHLPGFDTGPAHLGALVEVAKAYLSNFQTSKGTTPESRLLKLLNQDREWVRLALHGLRQCLLRGERPSAEDILALKAKSRRYHLATPCLAAMALREAEHPATALDLPDATLEMVAAFQLTNSFGEPPSWFKRLLAQQPGVVAKLMLKRIGAQIALKKEHISGIHELAHDTNYAEVAKQITLPLITTFPLKANKALLPALRTLMLAAMRHVAPEALSQLIADKLKNKTLDVAQHVYWLTAGLLLAPDPYLEPMRKYIGHNQARSHHAFNFIYQRRGSSEFSINLSLAAQTFLIGLLGPHSNPGWSNGSGFVTTEMNMGEYVAGLISNLAGHPDDAATQALTDLQQRPNMKQWHNPLSRALYDQRIARRKALFTPATVKQVCSTLANLQPASAADLLALTVDHLSHLIRQIRDSDKDIYDQYWDGDTPKSEERCRNALLTALEPRLSPLAITAIPERQLADKKRADIGIASGLIHIPLEAKGEWNPDLWKAINRQLIAQYCREPASDGYGIYLVFWFTGQMKAAPSDGGNKPKTPQELQQRLTTTVPESFKHKIAVLVVDCSKPPATNK